QQVDDAALARAARPQDRNALAAVDCEVDRFQRHDRAIVERSAHVGERDQPGRRLAVRHLGADQPLNGGDHLRSDSITASMLLWLARRAPRKSSCALIIARWPSKITPPAANAPLGPRSCQAIMRAFSGGPSRIVASLSPLAMSRTPASVIGSPLY